MSAKLLVDDSTIDTTTGRIKGLVDVLNLNLPPSIRIFTATKVHQSFRAREDCIQREYKYFIPLAFLQQLTPSHQHFDVTVQRLCEILPVFEGIHDFHNFTRRRRQHHHQIDDESTQRQPRRTKEEEEEEHFFTHDRTSRKMVLSHPPNRILKDAATDFDHGQDDAHDKDDNHGEANLDHNDDQPHYPPPPPRRRRPPQQTRRTIYRCRGSFIADFSGAPYVRVDLAGASFLLHQIRCMVGAAVGVATGSLPPSVLDAALCT
jgi:tRNA pseudouridine38-40 synthase